MAWINFTAGARKQSDGGYVAVAHYTDEMNNKRKTMRFNGWHSNRADALEYAEECLRNEGWWEHDD